MEYIKKSIRGGDIMKELYLKSVDIKKDKIPQNDYIYDLSVIKNFKKIEFKKPITIFVGENGLGKSTLIEAMAIKWGFNAEGGSRYFNFKTRQTESDLNKYIKIIRGPYRAKDGYFLRSESLYNVASNIDDLDEIKCDAPPISLAYGGKSLHNQSHGESFLSIFFKRFTGNGLYILDEPEAALSPVSQMSLLIRINELVNLNSQFIIATHSPILLAIPNAEVLEITEKGIRPKKYFETEYFKAMKNFFENTEKTVDSLINE